MKLLLDEMYPGALAQGLRSASVDAVTVGDLHLKGSADPEVFAAAIAAATPLVTENVADFARIAADHLSTGGQHPGVVIALSSRFSRRPAGRRSLVNALLAIATLDLEDRLLYLERAEDA